MRARLGIAVAALALGGCGGGSGSPLRGDMVAFLAIQQPDETTRLFVSDADGTHLRDVSPPLDPKGAVSEGFLWSPDRTHLAFTATPVYGGAYHLYVLAEGADAAVEVPAPVPNADVYGGDWSPDGGRLLLFTYESASSRTRLFAHAVAGGATTELTPPVPAGLSGVNTAHWSPDGTRVAFTAELLVDGKAELYSVAANGTDLHQVSKPPVAGAAGMDPYDGSFAWLADSSKLVFTGALDTIAKYEVYSASPDGTNHLRVSDPALYSTVWDFHLAPQGSRIAYRGKTGGPVNDPILALFGADAGGGANVLLGDPATWGEHAIGYGCAFSPDGTRVLFVAEKDLNFADTEHTLLVVPAVGGPATVLAAPSPGLLGASEFAWSPDGSRIAFGAERLDPTDGTVDALHVVSASGVVEADVWTSPSYGGSFKIEGLVWSPSSQAVFRAIDVNAGGSGGDMHFFVYDRVSHHDTYLGTNQLQSQQRIAAWTSQDDWLAYASGPVFPGAPGDTEMGLRRVPRDGAPVVPMTDTGNTGIYVIDVAVR